MRHLYIFHGKVNVELAKETADLQYYMEHERVKLAKEYAANETGFMDDPVIDRLYKNVSAATEEFEDCKRSLYMKAFLSVPSDTRRWAFRTFRNRTIAQYVTDFIRHYNEWTFHTVEYLIVEARKEHDSLKFQKIIDTVVEEKKRTELLNAMTQVESEYDQMLKQKKCVLDAYVADIYVIAKKLKVDYNVGQYLEKRKCNEPSSVRGTLPFAKNLF